MRKLKIPPLFIAAVALVVLAVGLATVANFDRMGVRFARLGVPDWTRILVGLVQVLAAVGLVTPGRTGYGAALAFLTSGGAVLAHAGMLGWDSAPPAIVLAIASGVILWRHRADFKR